MRPGQLSRLQALDALTAAGLNYERAVNVLLPLARAGLYLCRMPRHGTRACYNSGWPKGQEQPVSGPGCRCDECAAANATYLRAWRSRKSKRKVAA